MRYPLIVLAFLSVTGGFLGIPHALGGGNLLETWLEPVFERSSRLLDAPGHGSVTVEYLLMALSVAAGVAGIFLARRMYLAKPAIADNLAKRFGAIHNLLFRKYFVDEIYDGAVITPIKTLSDKLLWKGIDAGMIDGAVNGLARLTAWLSGITRKMQTGNVSGYGLAVLVGISVLLGIYLFR